MIRNERQYRITKSQIAKFEAALADVTERSNSGVSARLRNLEQDALGSQLEELREEAAEYERLRSGRRQPVSIPSFDQLPRALVQARIARGWSQRELADRVGLKEQQIQWYEATEYASASLKRIKKVMEALGAELAAEMTYSHQ